MNPVSIKVFSDLCVKAECIFNLKLNASLIKISDNKNKKKIDDMKKMRYHYEQIKIDNEKISKQRTLL